MHTFTYPLYPGLPILPPADPTSFHTVFMRILKSYGTPQRLRVNGTPIPYLGEQK